MSSGEESPSPRRARPRPALTVAVSDGPPSSAGMRVSQLLENPTPRTRRVSKLPVAEARRAPGRRALN
jgi:hypothetical protein